VILRWELYGVPQLTNLPPSLYTQRMEKSPARWWDLPSAFSLLILILLPSWRLEATNWTDGLNHIRNMAVLGLFVGLALGQSIYRRRGIILLSISYFLVFAVWQWLAFIDFPRDVTYIGDRLVILSGRLWVSLNEYLTGRPVDDPLLFIAALSIPYWLIGIFSGFQMTRHARILACTLPSGVLMVLVHLNHYTQSDYSWLFALYLFMALLFVSRQKYIVDKTNWLRERVMVSSDSSLDINNTTMVFAAALVMLAWLIPLSLPLNEQARQTWRDWFAERDQQTEEIFTFINRESIPPAIYNFVQTELPLGTGISQSEAVEFLVYAPVAAQRIPRLYWRGAVYDQFEQGRWHITELDSTAFRPQDGDFKSPRWTQRRTLTFTFDTYEKGQRNLYAPPQPAWTNRNVNLLHVPIDPDNELMDVMLLQASPSINPGDVYRVTAVLADPTIIELQNAGENYPEWVLKRYLQLPEVFSPRIRELAQEITDEYDNSYDKAVAVTNYLREEITYTPEIIFPENTVDRIEYFLFEGKEGFCNYYATAEVLMLRSVGIPARMAVGYARGEPNLQNTLYTVRERDLHAWPEVYFPEYGWVEFEPTVNQDPIERPQDREESSLFTPTPPADLSQIPLLDDEAEPPISVFTEENQTELSSRTQFTRIAITAGLILLLGIAIHRFRRQHPAGIKVAILLKDTFERRGWSTPNWLESWSAWELLSPIERYFQSINISLRWMGIPQPAHMTAAERANILKSSLPAAIQSIDTLLNELQTELFSPQGGDPLPARRAAWSLLHQTARARIRIFIMGYN
jgi:transglutaminase-like putative cysteine protease